MTKQIQTVGEETKIAEIITRYLVKRGREGQMWQNQAFNSGLIKELSQFIAQAQQEAVNAERARLLPYLMNGYEDVDDFVSSNYREFMNSSNDPDDDSIQMAELYEKLKSELEALQTKGQNDRSKSIS